MVFPNRNYVFACKVNGKMDILPIVRVGIELGENQAEGRGKATA